MKILYYFQKINSSMYMWQISHIVDELTRHGIKIDIFNPLDYETYEQANKELILHLKTERYDLFMTDQNRGTLFAETVSEIHRYGVPCLLIHFDNLMDPKRHVGYAQYFDVVMLLNKDDTFDYKQYKCKCIVAPYASNPYYFNDLRKCQPARKTTGDICFIGTPYGTRCTPINRVIHAGIPFDLYANKKSVEESYTIGSNMGFLDKVKVACKQLTIQPGRKVLLSAIKCKLQPMERLDKDNSNLNLYNAVEHHEMNELYSQYSLSLSMPEARNTGVLKKPVNVVRLRNFEIPMCAGLQITKYYEELADYFEEDKEIVFYYSDEELIEKVKYYTDPKHQSEVDAMKTAARKRAENEHTWFCRFRTVFDYLGLNY